MSFVSTLDQAREFLLLAPDIDAASVLQLARDRRGELRAKSADARSPVIGRQGAARKLKLLEPLLPVLEIEAELAALETVAAVPPGPQIHKLRLEQRKLAASVAALAAGDERTILVERLSVVEAALLPKAAPVEVPPDPALATLTARLAALREAIDRKEKNKIRLSGLLAEARGVASVLRDAPARQQAAAQLEDLSRLVDGLLSAARDTVPPFSVAEDPTEKIIIEKIKALRAAVEKQDRARALFLLDSARDLASVLRVPAARARAEAELSALAAELDRAAAPPTPVVAEKKAVAVPVPRDEKPARPENHPLVATVRTLAEPPVANERRGSRDLGEGERVAARNRAEEAALIEKLGVARQAVARGELAVAEKCLVEARVLSAAWPERAKHEPALVEIARLIADAKAADARGKPDPGLVLRLLPKGGTVFTGPVPASLRFVARPRFLLGREELERPSRADFLTPRNFGQVGRINVTLTRKDDEILVQDGDGERKSTNGSMLDEELLTPEAVPASFVRERTLLLSTVFSLTAQHLPGDAPGGPPLASAGSLVTGRTVVISRLSGAMRFLPKGELPLPHVAVWLFTDATIGSAPGCAVSLPQAGLAETHARLHFWQGGFWIENLRSGVAVRLGEHTLAKGEIRALHQHEVLKLGNTSYDVQVEN